MPAAGRATLWAMLQGETQRPVRGAPTGEAYDFIVVGSGFGGSVSALRLAEKGYRVLVVEAGKRFRAEDFPKTNWNLRRYLWLPALGCHGIQRITLLKDALVLSGAGVGGGSLVYANTLLAPHDEVFSSGAWPRGSDWKARLAPHYATARRLLGVVSTPRIWAGDEALAAFAAETGRADSFTRTEVAVLFGERSGEDVGDPYFGGEGPDRTTCTTCGGCMVGCRFNAKNTLDKNYLFFAEKLGAEIMPETAVTLIEPDGEGGYLLHTHRSTRALRRGRGTLRSRGVVLAAGALGTTDLLLRCREAGALPNLAPSLGLRVRTNSEVLVRRHGTGRRRRLLRGDRHRQLALRFGRHPPRGRPLLGGLGLHVVPGDAADRPRYAPDAAAQVGRGRAFATRSTSCARSTRSAGRGGA